MVCGQSTDQRLRVSCAVNRLCRSRNRLAFRLASSLWKYEGCIHTEEFLGVREEGISLVLSLVLLIPANRKFWHQFVRQPFTSLGNFVSRDVFNLPRSSILERHTNLFVIFFISSVFHVIVDLIQSVPMEYSGSIPFYLAFVPGIMLEDGVQQLWERLFPEKRASSQQAEPPFWQRIVGFVWVMVWLGITSTWYFTPMIQLTSPDVVMVPVSLAARIGLATSVGVALVNGVGLILAFEVEI